MNQKGFANIILIVVTVILLGVIGYFAFVQVTVPVTTSTPTGPTANWKIYRDEEQYGFEVRYPFSAGSVNYTVDDNCTHARSAFDGIDDDQIQQAQLPEKRICINYSKTFSDGMPSISDFWIRIYSNPIRLSLDNWLNQNYSDLGVHKVKRMQVEGNSVFIFGDYPWQVYEQRWRQWEESRKSFSTEEEWMNDQPIPGEPRIFMVSKDSRFIYSFTSYPYDADWDLVLSTFKFTK